jgi:hypothetical protein
MKRLTFLNFLLTGMFIAMPCFAEYQFLFVPKISVTEEYTDNLFLDNLNKENDFITIISPGIVAKVWDRTSDLTFDYEPGYSIYQNFTENNTLRHNARLYGKMAFSRHTRMTFQNAFIATEDPVSKITYPSADAEQTSADDQNKIKPQEPMTPQAERQKIREETVRKSRKQYYTDTTYVDLTHQFGKADLLTLKYNYNLLNNKDETIEDESTHNPAINFTYWLIPNQLGFKAATAYSKSNFSETAQNTAYSEESLTPSFGVTYRIDKNISIDTGLSYRKGTYSDPVLKNTNQQSHDSDEESLNPTFGLTYRIPLYKLDLGISVSYMEGRFSDDTKDFDNWYGTIKLSKQFTNRLTGFVKYAHTTTKFSEGGNENYSIYDPSVGITYLLGDKIPLTLSVGYFIRDMEISDGESALSLNGNIGKSWTFGRTTINFAGTSGYDQSYFGAKALGFGVFYDIKSALKHSFSKDTVGDVFASYRKDKYLDLKNTRNDENREAGAGISWFFFQKWASVRLGYTYRDVISTLSENSYTENRISLIFSAADPRLLRLKP